MTKSVVEKALVEMRIEMTASLGQNAFAILSQVYRENVPLDSMDKTFLTLLHGLYILEYRNDDLWFAVNPIIKDLLEIRKLI